MGTRSLVHIHDKDRDSDLLVLLYRQYDGYPTGMGKDIKAILCNGKSVITNGFGMGQKAPEVFNGMGCLGAFLVKELKENIGNVYLEPVVQAGNDFGQEFEYHVFLRDEKVFLSIDEVYRGNTIYEGPIAEFDPETVEKKMYGDDEE